jgi:hypothetical protein
MAILIDPPPRFGPKEPWRQYLEQLKNLPREAWVELEIKDAERVLSQPEAHFKDD